MVRSDPPGFSLPTLASGFSLAQATLITLWAIGYTPRVGYIGNAQRKGASITALLLCEDKLLPGGGGHSAARQVSPHPSRRQSTEPNSDTHGAGAPAGVNQQSPSGIEGTMAICTADVPLGVKAPTAPSE